MPKFTIQAGNDVTVDADGDVMFQYMSGSDCLYGGEEELSFSIEELESILKTAKRHRAAYQAYKDGGWLDEADYDNIFYDK